MLDLGAGAGFDCFLAARAVGPTGRVIGVDMTPEMVAKARANVLKGGYANVEFRLGEIEHARGELPAPVRENLALHAGCISGAAAVGDVESMLRAAGFDRIRIAPKDESRSFIGTWSPDLPLDELIVAATIEALKPAG